MKKLLLMLLCGIAMVTSPPKAQAQAIYSFFGSGDTMKTATTKYLTLTVGSPGSLTVQFAYHHIGNNITGAAYLEGSVDNVDFSKVPGFVNDSVAFVNASASKIWFIDVPYKEVLRFKFWRLRIVTTTATGSGTVWAKLNK